MKKGMKKIWDRRDIFFWWILLAGTAAIGLLLGSQQISGNEIIVLHHRLCGKEMLVVPVLAGQSCLTGWCCRKTGHDFRWTGKAAAAVFLCAFSAMELMLFSALGVGTCALILLVQACVWYVSAAKYRWTKTKGWAVGISILWIILGTFLICLFHNEAGNFGFPYFLDQDLNEYSCSMRLLLENASNKGAAVRISREVIESYHLAEDNYIHFLLLNYGYPAAFGVSAVMFLAGVGSILWIYNEEIWNYKYFTLFYGAETILLVRIFGGLCYTYGLFGLEIPLPFAGSGFWGDILLMMILGWAVFRSHQIRWVKRRSLALLPTLGKAVQVRNLETVLDYSYEVEASGTQVRIYYGNQDENVDVRNLLSIILEGRRFSIFETELKELLLLEFTDEKVWVPVVGEEELEEFVEEKMREDKLAAMRFYEPEEMEQKMVGEERK